MFRKAFPLSVLIIVIVMALVAACGGMGTVVPIEVVPQKSDLLVQMDLSGLLDEEGEFSELLDSVADDPDEMKKVEDVLEIIGGLEEGLLFAYTSNAAQNGENTYSGVIVKGTFVENDLVLDIEAASEMNLESVGYKDYKIFTDADRTFGLAFISSDAFVMGDMNAVKDVIDVKEGAEPAVSGDVLSIYNSLSDGLVKLAMSVPPGLIEEQSGNDLGLSIEYADSFSDIETVGLTFDSDKGDVSIEARVCLGSKDSAEDVKESIESMITLLEMFSTGDDGDALAALVDKLHLTVDGDCLDISFEATSQEIEDIFGSVEGMMNPGQLGSGFDFDEEFEFDNDFFESYEFAEEWSDELDELFNDFADE